MMQSLSCILQDAMLDVSARASCAIERHPMAALAITALVVLLIVGLVEGSAA